MRKYDARSAFPSLTAGPFPLLTTGALRERAFASRGGSRVPRVADGQPARAELRAGAVVGVLWLHGARRGVVASWLTPASEWPSPQPLCPAAHDGNPSQGEGLFLAEVGRTFHVWQTANPARAELRAGAVGGVLRLHGARRGVVAGRLTPAFEWPSPPNPLCPVAHDGSPSQGEGELLLAQIRRGSRSPVADGGSPSPGEGEVLVAAVLERLVCAQAGDAKQKTAGKRVWMCASLEHPALRKRLARERDPP